MNRTDHLLWNVAEECAEVSQRASKAARFSLSEIQPGQPYTNAERLMHEWADLCGVMELLLDEGLLVMPTTFTDRVRAKKERFEKYLERSKEHGRLTGGPPEKIVALHSDVL